MEQIRLAGLTADAPLRPASRVRVTRDGVELAGLDRIIGAVVPRLRILPRLPWGILGVVIALTATLIGLRWPESDPASPVLRSALLLIVLDYALLAVHELGHAIVLHWYGERIGRVGFGLYWGMPCFYVDATAALMLPRRARAWQASAGVIAEGLVVALLVVAAAVTHTTTSETLAGQAAVLVVSSVLINLVPALGLDGQWLMADLTNRPDLVTGAAGPRSGWARAYRHSNTVVGVVFLAVSVLLWASLWADLIVPLWTEGWLGAALALFTVLPMILGLIVNTTIVLTSDRD